MDKVTQYFENSFLRNIIKEPTVSDVSFNGEDFFYEDKNFGRKKLDLNVKIQDISDFLRQIANLSEKQFSYQNPILDISFSKYRLNAVFSNLVKVGDEKSFSFDVRICSNSCSLDSGFFEGNAMNILIDALNKHESIVISGSTSSGKTQLQKYLIMHLKENSRVIVIDNVKEIEMIRDNSSIDLTTWQVDENVKSVSFSELIKNALRNNPDYIVVAESRGKEMLQALNSVMSGHPIITTIHAKDINAIPHRMARMTMMGGEKQLYEDALDDIYHHFSIVVYLRKQTSLDGSIQRYIETIGKLNPVTKKVDLIYERDKK